MQSSSPLFSIVIASFNYGRFLETAIQSILSQSCKDFELIIVDGGSTDNSVEIIEKYQERLAWWCSEKDKGQSDAFNKGFSHATGRFFTWLNADDVLFPGALERVKRSIKSNPVSEWFAGGCFWLEPDLKVILCSRARPFSKIRAQCGLISVWGPSSFFSNSLFNRVGGVDTQFNYMMDTELWNRFYISGGARYIPVSGYCWGLRLHPDAKMSGHNFESSPMSNPNHPVWMKRKRESEIVHDKYARSTMTIFKRLLTMSPIIYIAGRIDTLRFRSLSYSRVLK